MFLFFTQSWRTSNIRGFSSGRRPAIFADHWTTNDLQVAGNKFITIIYFFLSETIFREKIISLSNKDTFDNDKISFNNDNDNIWHFSIMTGINYVSICFCIYLRARLHETRSELKPLWNVIPFTWQFAMRFHCSNFPNNSKTLLHMCKWYLLINANLINAKQMLRYWLFFKQ